MSTAKKLASIDRICGVDFSGARDAGRHIWIAEGAVRGKTLEIKTSCRADRRLGCSTSVKETLDALTSFISSSVRCAFGLDFPFGLPKELVKRLAGKKGWEKFVLAFPEKFRTPDGFREWCWQQAGCRELRRKTDDEAGTPMSPYNRRLYKQTYYGLLDVLRPLVKEHLARVMPMQKPDPGKPTVLEICPASTLKKINKELATGYKSKSRRTDDPRRRKRKQILGCLAERLAGHAKLKIGNNARKAALCDWRGDALDSIIAAVAVFAALRDGDHIQTSCSDHLLEGYVYQ